MLNQHQTIKDNIAKYNKLNPLASFLTPFISGKKDVSILDVGSGPYSIIGDLSYDAVNLFVTHCDNQDFTAYWKRYNTSPVVDIEYQNMEKLNYPDNSFDLVVCINALDHTNNALAAVEEMIRVCKIGGYVYIDCHLDQKDTGHKHKWNAQQDGTFTNGSDTFDLKELGFQIEFINNGGENRYNRIVATLKKEGEQI